MLIAQNGAILQDLLRGSQVVTALVFEACIRESESHPLRFYGRVAEMVDMGVYPSYADYTET